MCSPLLGSSRLCEYFYDSICLQRLEPGDGNSVAAALRDAAAAAAWAAGRADKSGSAIRKCQDCGSHLGVLHITQIGGVSEHTHSWIACH